MPSFYKLFINISDLKLSYFWQILVGLSSTPPHSQATKYQIDQDLMSKAYKKKNRKMLFLPGAFCFLLFSILISLNFQPNNILRSHLSRLEFWKQTSRRKLLTPFSRPRKVPDLNRMMQQVELCIPRKRYDQELTPGICEWVLIWQRSLCRCSLGLESKHNDWCPQKRRERKFQHTKRM